MAAKNKQEAREQATKIVNQWAIGATAVAWIPGSHLALRAADVGLCMEVATTYGVTLTSAAAKGLMAQFVASAVGSTVAHTLADFIPIAGQIFKMATAGAITKGIGALMIAHFEEVSQLPNN